MLYPWRHGKVKISFGRKHITIPKDTLKRYLPRLGQASESYPRGCAVVAEDYLNLGDSRQTEPALNIIFAYLDEINRTGTSSLLLSKLDFHWKTSRQRIETKAQLFECLGRILSPANFGCCLEIWTHMNQFFSRRCAEIIQASPYTWTIYINALERVLSGLRKTSRISLTTPLAEVLRHKQLSSSKLTDLYRLSKLSPTSLSILNKLLHTKYSNHHSLYVYHPSWPQLTPSNSILDPRMQFRGDEIDPYFLHDICNRYPEAVKINWNKAIKLSELERYGYRSIDNLGDGEYAYMAGGLGNPHQDAIHHHPPRFYHRLGGIEDEEVEMLEYPGYESGMVVV